MGKLSLVFLTVMVLCATAIAQQTSTSATANDGSAAASAAASVGAQTRPRSFAKSKPTSKPKMPANRRPYRVVAGGTAASSTSSASITVTGASEAELAALKARVAALEAKPDRSHDDDLELARLKGQLDGLASRLGAVEDAVNNHEQRLVALETTPKKKGHSTRNKVLWFLAGVGTGVAIDEGVRALGGGGGPNYGITGPSFAGYGPIR